MLTGALPRLWLLPEGSDRERASQYMPSGLKLLGSTAGDLPSMQLRSSNKQSGEELINKVACIYYLTGSSCFTNQEASPPEGCCLARGVGQLRVILHSSEQRLSEGLSLRDGCLLLNKRRWKDHAFPTLTEAFHPPLPHRGGPAVSCSGALAGVLPPTLTFLVASDETSLF